MHKPHALTLIASCFFGLAHADTNTDWYYTVKSGENLWSIARTHLQSLSMVPALQQQNGIRNPYALQAGSALRIPLNWMKQHVSSATVSDLVGSADIAGEVLKPGQRFKLAPGSEIRTGAQSALKLILEDGSLISLGSQARLKVQTATHFPSTAANSNLLLLQQGSVENIILKNPLMPTRHDIATPSAVTAVRGTRFRVNIDQPGRSATEVASGLVGVNAGEAAQQLQGGEGNVTIAGQPPGKSQPLPMPPTLDGISALQNENPPVLTWPEVAGMAGYQVTLTRQSPKRQIIDDSGRDRGYYYPPLMDGKYLLAVRSRQADGLQGIPVEREFELRSQPATPLIVAPQDGDKLQGREMNIRLAGEQKRRYLLQISANADMRDASQITLDSPTYQHQLPAAGTWYWRVATLDEQSQAGPFSRTFAIHAEQGFWRASRHHLLRFKGREYPLTKASYELRIENLTRKEADIVLQSANASWAMSEPLFPGNYRLTVLINGANGYVGREPQRTLTID